MAILTSDPLAEAPVRCSAWAREEGLDPIGTAGLYSAYLVVEWPLPWPRDISEIPELAAVQAQLSEPGIRLQAVAPADPARPRLVLHRRTDPFVGYRRSEVAVTTTLEAAVDALLSRDPSTSDGDGPAGHEVLVCTHGRRDRCCGSLGTILHQSLVGEHVFGPGVELHRTSHTGGHRFAPTAVVLPEGTLWAFADADLLSRVVGRRGPLDDVLPRYRGCIGLGSRAQQAVERAVLGEVGWDLFGLARRGEEADGTTLLHVTGPDGTVTTWAAEVTAGRTMPTPDCGSPLSEAKKSETELVVSGLRTIH